MGEKALWLLTCLPPICSQTPPIPQDEHLDFPDDPADAEQPSHGGDNSLYYDLPSVCSQSPPHSQTSHPSPPPAPILLFLFVSEALERSLRYASTMLCRLVTIFG